MVEARSAAILLIAFFAINSKMSVGPLFPGLNGLRCVVLAARGVLALHSWDWC